MVIVWELIQFIVSQQDMARSADNGGMMGANHAQLEHDVAMLRHRFPLDSFGNGNICHLYLKDNDINYEAFDFLQMWAILLARVGGVAIIILTLQ